MARSQSVFEKVQKAYGFKRKHAKPHRYVTSGPPRALESQYDDKAAVRESEDGTAPHVLARMAALRQRDEQKLFGSKDFKIPSTDKLPPKPPMKDADLQTYDVEASLAAREGRSGSAYWLFMKASECARSLAERGRYEEYANANLKTWRAITLPSR